MIVTLCETADAKTAQVYSDADHHHCDCLECGKFGHFQRDCPPVKLQQASSIGGWLPMEVIYLYPLTYPNTGSVKALFYADGLVGKESTK